MEVVNLRGKKRGFSINWYIIALILCLNVFSAVIYPSLPEMVPSHWNISGEVDGYIPKIAHVIGLPTLTLVVYLLMALAPFADPKPESYRKFSGVFEGFRIIMVFVLASLYVATSIVALGYNLPVGKIAMVIIGVMLVYTGNYFGKIRHNFTFGIKTPWTLANEEVWNKTHRVSGPLWVTAGIIWMISVVLPERAAFIIDLSVLLAVSLYGVVYSYILFKKLNPPGGGNGSKGWDGK